MEERHLSDDIYKIILEDTFAGYWYWNIKEHEEYISPSYKKMFGYEDHELANSPETWKQHIFPEDIDIVLHNYKEHVQSKGAIPYNNEVRYRHKNGDTVWVMSTGRVIEWDGDEPLKMVGSHIDITRQKEAELELRSAQRFLEKTNEAARIGAWEVNLATSNVYWSEVTRQIHEVPDGYSPELDTAIEFFKKGKSRDRITKAFGQLAQDGTPYDLQLQIITGTGKEKWVRAVGQAEFSDGVCIKAYGTFQDIDAQQRIQEELAQSEVRFREAFENSAIGIALVSPEGKWLRVNKQVCEITGYPEEELLVKTFQDITHPEDLDLDLNNVLQLLEGKIDSYKMEKRYYHKYGHIVWVLLSVSLVRTADGTPVHFISQIEDITQRKLAEQELNRANQELTSLFESITQVSVIATDQEGLIKHFSKGSETLLGYTADEMINKQTPAIIHAKDEVVARGKELSEIFNRKIEGFDVFVEYAKQGKFESREWTYVRKDGSTFPVQLVVTSVKDGDGNITGFLGIAVDITEQKKTEEHLQRTVQTINEQNTRLFNFAHIVSHNLRSHTGNLALLLELYGNTEDAQEKSDLLTHMMSVSNNLSETIVHLNEVVSINTNISEQLKELNLNSYIRKTIQTLSGEINKYNVRIENNVPDDVVVMYNEAYLESILLNFLSNTIKYRSQERQPVIKIGMSLSNDEKILEIADNGLGINMERNGKKLFGMYKTFHGNEDAKGIGLFITKNQVEAMGGRIEVESEENKGTTFKIYIR